MQTTSAPFSFRKDGVWYFSRRVPKDVRDHYRVSRITYSLRTRSASQARARALAAAAKLDQHWHFLRMGAEDLPGRHLMVSAEVEVPTKPASPSPTELGPTVREAGELYLRLKGAENRPKTFAAAAWRSLGYLVDACGSKRLAEYTRQDATKFRDALIARGLNGASVSRVLGTVRAIFNLAISETGQQIPNPFRQLYVDGKSGVRKRAPVPVEEIRRLQKACLATDDEARWLVALVTDTGMRLAEVAGLAVEDLVLDAPVPHVVVRPHPWRRLKNGNSEREVPLVGSSLWAARRILASSDTVYAFPRYNKTDKTTANSASAALNKWLKEVIGSDYSMHCLRHSLRDRLRAVECPSDIVDQIGGWHTQGIGQAYGTGYPLPILKKWLDRICA